MLFSQLDIIKPILKAIETKGYKSPTPIQEKAIPAILDGKDFLGTAQTGTGKTAAFAIPILQILEREKQLGNVSRAIKCLILTPTRELAIQIEENIATYGANLKQRHCVIFGGIKQHSQVRKLQSGVDILVATPGRLLDLMEQGYVKLDQVKIFTLDEADRMLDMGFINDVKKVLTKLPAKKQTLFFSATMPNQIVSLSDSLLDHPVKVEITPVSSTADTVKQSVFFVKTVDKKNLLIDILEGSKIKSMLVFTRTKHGADKVVVELEKANITAGAIHGNKSQNARQRALTSFKAGKMRVLVATDIAARGIDIDDLGYMVNYDISNEPETYVHRIGRTGRAWKNGTAFSFCSQEEVEYLLDVQKIIGKKIDVVTDHPYAITVDESIKAPKRQQNQRRNFTSKRPENASRKRNVRRKKNKRS